MGFNIGVWSDQTDKNNDCDEFIDRVFYYFVDSVEMWGDKSILIQAGKYYKIDLSPLQKIVYTNGDLPKEYIESQYQDVNMLLSLVKEFRIKVKEDPNGCDKMEYDPAESDNSEEHPYKHYFESGDIIEDLDSLIRYLQFYKNLGVKEVYLTAG